jgi:pyrroloquinoline quinone (PQQ) biosynthesis protein C
MDIRRHPFPSLVNEGRASIEGIREFVQNFYLLSSRGPKNMLIKLFYCADPELSRELAANIYEEFTGGLSGTTGHMDLFARFVRAAGLDAEECLNPADPTPLQRDILAGYAGWRELSPDDILLSMGHIHAGGEAATSANFGRIADGLVAHYGFRLEEVKFFSVHVEADKGHGDFQVKCMERFATTPERQARAREYIFRSLDRMMRVYNSGLIGAT